MADGWRQFTMRCLRVPPPPEPPLGAPGSERVFRSGRNALRLSLTVWAFQQVIAVVGLAFWLTVLGEWRILREAPVREGDVPAAGPQADPDFIGPPRAPGRASRRVEGPRDLVARLSRGTPEGLIGWWTFFERVALATFVLQFPVTYALRRLEYEQRWYVVTDRSLRLRSGVWTVREVTMSFANLQQITVSQNPLQRLLGLSDVRVQSAGGGGGMPKPDVAGESAHLGYFRSVDNGGEIRDLITARLRAFRESGLGDPEEGRRATMGPAPPAAGTAALAAAAELLEETRALRRAWNRASRPPGPPG